MLLVKSLVLWTLFVLIDPTSCKGFHGSQLGAVKGVGLVRRYLLIF